MTPDIDLETLRLLVTLAETGSLGKAAAAHGITQPAASGRVKAFEVRWRMSVVSRSPSGSRLTTDGEAVVSWAKTVLHAADVMRASLTALSAERGTNLKIAASLTVAEHILPRWLGELSAQRPDVNPTLAVVNSQHVLETVRSGEADLGFIESAQLPIGFAQRVVGRDRLVVVVHPGHLWARRSTALTGDELRSARWVIREPGSGTRGTFESALRHQPDIALEATSTAALVGAAAAGVGPAVVSARSVTAELETGRLVEVLTDLDLLRPLTAVWRQEERLGDSAVDLLTIASQASRRP